MDKELQVIDELFAVTEQSINKVSLMYKFMDFGTGVPLHLKEIHAVQAIGRNPGITVTELASQSQVTKSAVSQTIKKLVKKGLVKKLISFDNAKERHLELTNLGKKGYEAHEQVHAEMLTLLRKDLGEEFIPHMKMLISVLKGLNLMMDKYEKR